MGVSPPAFEISRGGMFSPRVLPNAVAGDGQES